eukprot:SAG11_NODE_10246_length_844_cov_1.939597_1_plen_114_part_01
MSLLKSLSSERSSPSSFALAGTVLISLCVAQTVGTDFIITPSPCGAGYSYLSDAEAEANAQAICAQIGDWSVVEVSHRGGPAVGGAGYGCAYSTDGCVSPCSEAVCKRSSGGGE